MKFELAQYSQRGARPTNQDRIATADRDNAIIMALADGLGGHAGGELAAETLVQTTVRSFLNVRQTTIDKPSVFLALTILQAHKAVVARGKSHIPPLDPRTTCVVCLVQNGYAYWAHVGDSRLYYFRNGKFVERTQDHTTIEQLRTDGLLSEEEMSDHPHKGHLLKCVGGPNKPTVSLGKETLLGEGDSLLLCSDGVWSAFTPDELADFLKYPSLDEGIEEMLFTAEKKTGKSCDNISAICLRWDEAVTDSLPLQGNQAVQVDEEMLREAAAGMTAFSIRERKQQKPKPKRPKKTEDNRSLETRIQELEEYLRKFEPQ